TSSNQTEEGAGSREGRPGQSRDRAGHDESSRRQAAESRQGPNERPSRGTGRQGGSGSSGSSGRTGGSRQQEGRGGAGRPGSAGKRQGRADRAPDRSRPGRPVDDRTTQPGPDDGAGPDDQDRLPEPPPTYTLPPLPDDIEPDLLAPEVRSELRSLS